MPLPLGMGRKADGWSNGLFGQANPATVVVTQDIAVTTTFTPITPAQYAVTLQITGSASIALFPVDPFTSAR
jgi:hypothetical protein